MASIKDLKSTLGVATLPLAIAKDEKGVDSGFVTYWDNERRVRVVMHKDCASAISKNADAFMAWRKEEKVSGTTKTAYTQYMCFIPKAEPVFTL